MGKWKELDKNNLPSDILVEGRYEFIEEMYLSGGQPWETPRSVALSIGAVCSGGSVLYRKKKEEVSYDCAVERMCIHRHYHDGTQCKPDIKTGITFSLNVEVSESWIKPDAKVKITITPIDEEGSDG